MARKRAFIPPIERVGDGFVFNIGDDERQLVSRLLTELSQLLMGESDDPRLIRIFPPAYHLADDADADAEYQRLMREDLVASRLSGIATVNLSLQSPGPVDEETMISFVQQSTACAWCSARCSTSSRITIPTTSTRTTPSSANTTSTTS